MPSTSAHLETRFDLSEIQIQLERTWIRRSPGLGSETRNSASRHLTVAEESTRQLNSNSIVRTRGTASARNRIPQLPAIFGLAGQDRKKQRGVESLT